MFKGVKLGLCVAVVASSIASFAQGFEAADHSDWKLSIGATYRTFKSVDFKKFAIDNGAEYLDGTVGNPLNPFDQQTNVDGSTLPPPHDTVGPVVATSLHTASFNGGSDELDNAMGLTLMLSAPISEQSEGLSLDVSFVFVTSSISETIGADVVTYVDYDGTPAGSDAEGDMLPGGKGANVPVRYKMDVALCTLGAGVSKSFDMGALDLSVGFGPTLTFAYYDAERNASQVFSTPTDGAYSESVKDDGLDVLLGLYASVDATVAISESWALGCGLRYDWMVQDIETDVADIDVSGLSFELKAVYSF